MPKQIIFNSLKKSFQDIYKNKSIFLLLVILQIIFFAIFSFVSSVYIPKIMQHSKSMFDYLSQQKFDDISIAQNILQQKDILGDDPLSLSRNFNEIIKNFRIYLVYLFILLVAFISVIWSITHKLVNKYDFKKSLKNLYRIFVILLFYLGMIFMFFFYLLDISFAESVLNSSMVIRKYLLFFLVSIILLYFMLISISLANRIGLKDIVQRTLSIGIRKMHYMLSVYFVSLLLMLVSMLLLFYFSETSFSIVVLAMVLFVFSFLFGRIFMLNVIEKLESY